MVDFTESLLDAAVTRLSQREDINRYVRDIIDQFQRRVPGQPQHGGRANYQLSSRCGRWNQAYALLGCSGPFSMECLATEDESPIFFADDTDDENCVTLFQFTMTFCGAGAEKHQELQMDDNEWSAWLSKPDDEPFVHIVHDVIKTTIRDDTDGANADAGPFWACLESICARYFNPVDSYEWDRRGRFLFRQQVAINFLLSSERQPFRIPALIFRRAADQDLRYERSYWPYDPLLSQVAHTYIHQLFEIDPTSLPRGDPLIQQWAVVACQRIRHYTTPYQQYFLHRVIGDDDGNGAMARDYDRDRQWLGRYLVDVETRMLRYIKTGEAPYGADHPAAVAPHLHNPIEEFKKRCSGVADTATYAAEHEPEPETFDSHEEGEAHAERYMRSLADGPMPTVLSSFLDESDFRRLSVLHACDPREVHYALVEDEDFGDGDITSYGVSRSAVEAAVAAANGDGDDDGETQPKSESEPDETVVDWAADPDATLDHIAGSWRGETAPPWWTGSDSRIPRSLIDDLTWYKAP